MNIERTQEVITAIKRENRVTKLIRLKYFLNCSVQEIRDWLEANGLDRHMPIQYVSTEIIVQVPGGILMQIRANETGKLGLWGGIVQSKEQVTPSAIRKFYEKTGIQITQDDLMYIDTIRHMHKYPNGDFAYLSIYRYALKFDSIPKIKLNDDSIGWKIISTPDQLSQVFEHQRGILNKILREPNYQGEDY